MDEDLPELKEPSWAAGVPTVPAVDHLGDLLDAILAGRTAWVEWTKWPGETMQQEINLAGIKSAYDECVKATSR